MRAGEQDAEIGANDGSFRLRSERSGTGPGRVYTVTYSAVDASKNTTTAVALVTVLTSLGQQVSTVFSEVSGVLK